MFIDRFLGRRPSHFEIDPVVRAYIISESILWGSWDFVIPIFSVFVVNGIPGGTVQIAASGYSIYLITRVVFELISGRLLQNSHDRKKFIMTIFGITVLSIGYFGFAFTNSILQVFLFYAALGVGLGIAAPAKNSLFSMHLDKNRESTEWSLTDAISFISMAFSTALGGFIAMVYGFKMLFIIAAITNLISALPYLLYINNKYQK